MQRPEPRDEVEMLALMLLIRRFEERASQQYQAKDRRLLSPLYRPGSGRDRRSRGRAG